VIWLDCFPIAPGLLSNSAPATSIDVRRAKARERQAALLQSFSQQRASFPIGVTESNEQKCQVPYIVHGVSGAVPESMVANEPPLDSHFNE
jgi:hypothetical protein